ncbi:hypothetical protein EJ08DRAFT_668485 [Tothia fuscella]|uniref:RING-type domain-containing protein n=1 Tax=Tothia fuscella TaxID=1048955 RepID=A0A9P4NYX1_9PEZI|nr:hypothetical protein EJ08DRAFT_668485 [Tothia fuscella]
MSGYEVEHGVNFSEPPKKSTRRPDLSTFHATFNETFGDEASTINNANSIPTPENVTATIRLAADTYETIDMDHGGDNQLLRFMIERLDGLAMEPPTKRGVSDTFLSELERIPKSKLKKDESCPICSEAFLDDEYPLVVVLPCDPKHKFDLECIQPWLKLNATCPLDRKELDAKKEPPPKVVEEEEEDYDEYYA